MRIVSLVPSITETLFDFELTSNEIVGRTKFCIHPKEKVGEIPIIGGTKNIRVEEIIGLEPDLVIANKEENVKEQVEELIKSVPVWVTDIVSLEDNAEFLIELGNRLNKPQLAQQFVEKTEDVFRNINPEHSTKAAYLIWKNPWMTVGGDTFIHQILKQLGFKNIFSESLRYPVITEEKLNEADTILLSSEPFPFTDGHIKEFQKKFPDKTVKLVDGEAFSWFGSRPSKCGAYYQNLIKEIQQL